jgi:hypothetical protein
MFYIYSYVTRNNVTGSIPISCAQTEEDAKKKVRMLEKRSEEFAKMYPYGKDDPRAFLVYVTNNPQWWAANLSKIEALR